MNLYICIHLYHHHNQGTKYICHLSNFLVYFCGVCLFVCFCDKNTAYENYPLNIFYSAQYHIVNCMYYVTQHISRCFSSVITVSLCPLNNNSPLALLLVPGNSIPYLASISFTILSSSYK